MKTKLGPHYLNGGEDTASALLNMTSPSIGGIKFAQIDLDVLNNRTEDPFDPYTTMGLLHLAEQKGLTIVGRRIDELPEISLYDVPTLVDKWWGEAYSPGSPFPAIIQAFPQMHYWEVLNEPQANDDDATMAKWSEFLAAAARRMFNETGKKAVLGNWSVGQPDFPLWRHYGPVLQAVRDGCGVLGRHCYAYIDATDGPYYGLRYRLDQVEFDKLGFSNMPVILTECGMDSVWKNGQNVLGPWKSVFNNDVYRYWNEYQKLALDEYERDPTVLLVFPFTCGNGQAPAWTGYDYAHEPLAEAIAQNPPVIGEVTPPGTPFTHWVNPSGLNVRLFPWSGETVPPVQRIIHHGDLVQVYATVKFGSMQAGWGLISPEGSAWVNQSYLVPVSVPITDEPAVG